MSTDDPSSVSIQTEAAPIPSLPAWFGEVALVAHTLTRQGLLAEISERVRFSRKRFGTYEVIDFLVVLIGYALSGEPTLAAYYERLQPFATPFMALFGRTQLPHRSTLSRFLAALDQASVEALRSVFLQDAASPPWTRRGCRWSVGSARTTMGGLRSGRHETGCTTARPASESGVAPSTAASACGLCAWLHGAQAGRSGPHPHDTLAGPYSSLVNDKWSRIEEADRQS
jgi:hypothetical protein